MLATPTQPYTFAMHTIAIFLLFSTAPTLHMDIYISNIIVTTTTQSHDNIKHLFKHHRQPFYQLHFRDRPYNLPPNPTIGPRMPFHYSYSHPQWGFCATTTTTTTIPATTNTRLALYCAISLLIYTISLHFYPPRVHTLDSVLRVYIMSCIELYACLHLSIILFECSAAIDFS